MDDVRAVMDAVGVEQAALLGAADGGMMAALFAATYPQRVSSLVLANRALGSPRLLTSRSGSRRAPSRR